ncbi:nef attachable domain protein, partial [Chlamydia psittaci C1/97]
MEVIYHKAVSQKASFQFLTEDISFFTIGHYELPNITLHIRQELS